MSHTKNKSDSPRFKVGDKVRVKYGVSDPDFLDMPLGGWSGTVTEIIEHEGQINCVFKLDDRTLVLCHSLIFGFRSWVSTGFSNPARRPTRILSCDNALASIHPIYRRRCERDGLD